MTGQFRVLATPAFERDFRKISKGDTALVKVLEELWAILREDPHNRGGQHKIKKLMGLKPARGNGESAGENTVCVTTSSLTKSFCTPSATEKRPISSNSRFK